MNRVPTVDEYEQSKYLWFVALSRAKRDLRIYNLHNEQISLQMYKVPTHLY